METRVDRRQDPDESAEPTWYCLRSQPKQERIAAGLLRELERVTLLRFQYQQLGECLKVFAHPFNSSEAFADTPTRPHCLGKSVSSSRSSAQNSGLVILREYMRSHQGLGLYVRCILLAP
jgi:hypothetical protein